MAHCAEQVIRDNGCANKISLIHKRSTELTVGAGELLTLTYTSLEQCQIGGKFLLCSIQLFSEVLLCLQMLTCINGQIFW